MIFQALKELPPALSNLCFFTPAQLRLYCPLHSYRVVLRFGGWRICLRASTGDGVDIVGLARGVGPAMPFVGDILVRRGKFVDIEEERC
jgi:hypothetical protein